MVKGKVCCYSELVSVPSWLRWSQSKNKEVHLLWGMLCSPFVHVSHLPNFVFPFCKPSSSFLPIILFRLLWLYWAFPPTSPRLPFSHSLPLPLSHPPLLTVCRIGEAYRLATTIKVQQVSGGSSHHWSKLRKPSCDQRFQTEGEEKRES